MNTKAKLRNVFDFNTGAGIPEWEFAYWYDALQKWYTEGLPKRNPPLKIKNHQWVAGEAFPTPEANYARDVHEYFGFDEGVIGADVETGPVPPFEEQVLEENEEIIVYRRSDGKVVKTRKDGCSMPHFLEYPVKSEGDFEIIKERFDAEAPGRFPSDWDRRIIEGGFESRPIQLGGGTFSGFYSIIREMLGPEKSLFAFYDNPDFVKGMLNYFEEYYVKLYSRVLSSIKVDYILIWEDLAFKNGPLISPGIFRDFILPCYKRFTGCMKSLGIKNFIVDTDGNFEVLIPLFIEGGITGFYPFEVQAGMDVEKIRDEYPDLVIMGGIDKKALAYGKDAIDIEIEKVKRMISRGGYLPYTDHMVPPDVSFKNYSYYRFRLKEELDNLL